MNAHPGTIEFVDTVSGIAITRRAENMPPAIAFADNTPIVRFVIDAMPDAGRRILVFGANNVLLRTTLMIYREQVHPIRGKSGLTLPPSRAASTRKSSTWLAGWLASSYRTLSQLLAKLKLR